MVVRNSGVMMKQMTRECIERSVDGGEDRCRGAMEMLYRMVCASLTCLEHLLSLVNTRQNDKSSLELVAVSIFCCHKSTNDFRLKVAFVFFFFFFKQKTAYEIQV